MRMFKNKTLIVFLLAAALLCSAEGILYSAENRLPDSGKPAKQAEKNVKPSADKAEKEEFLTKGEAVALISSTDFVQRRISDLLSWSVGYDISKINRAQVAPIIKSIIAAPKKVPPDGRTILEVKVTVDDPGGLRNISGVRADLSSIGRLPNMMLVDNGLWGDKKSSDGTYTLQTNVDPSIDIGEKQIIVAAANKKGWMSMAQTSIVVDKLPLILWTQSSPSSVPADGKTKLLLQVKVSNPGRIQDVSSVLIDLTAFGGNAGIKMRNDGRQGDLKRDDDIFSLETVVPQGVSGGRKILPVKVENTLGGEAGGEIILEVL